MPLVGIRRAVIVALPLLVTGALLLAVYGVEPKMVARAQQYATSLLVFPSPTSWTPAAGATEEANTNRSSTDSSSSTTSTTTVTNNRGGTPRSTRRIVIEGDGEPSTTAQTATQESTAPPGSPPLRLGASHYWQPEFGWYSAVTSNESIDVAFMGADETTPTTNLTLVADESKDLLLSSKLVASTTMTANQRQADDDTEEDEDARNVALLLSTPLPPRPEGLERQYRTLQKALRFQNETEQVEVVETWNEVRYRTFAHGVRRVRALLRKVRSLLPATDAPSQLAGDREDAVLLQFSRCVVLITASLAEVPMDGELRCSAEWQAELANRQQWPWCTSLLPLLREALTERISPAPASPPPAAASTALRSFLIAVYAADPVHRYVTKRQLAGAQLLPRALEDPGDVDAFASDKRARFRLVNASWRTASIRSLRAPRVTPDFPGVGEGVCMDDSASGRFGKRGPSFNGLRHSSGDTLRMLLRIDATTAWDFLRQSASPSRDAKAASSERCGGRGATSIPRNRAVEFMRRSRWMFDSFVPFLSEKEGRESAPSRSDAIPADVAASPQTLDTAFRIRANRVVLQKSGTYKLSQLLAPLYYDMTNVCVSPHGFGLSAYAPPAWPSPKIPPELRDERRNKIRRIGLRLRTRPPTHFVDKPLVIHYVQYQSDNLGHVLYRAGAQQELLRRVLNASDRVFPGATQDDYLVGFLVIPNAQATFSTANSLRHVYQAFNQKWFSAARVADAIPLKPSAEDEDDELCFRRAVIGHEALFMYHSVGSTLAMRKRYLQAALGSQVHVKHYFEHLRSRLQSCLLRPFPSLLVPHGSEVAPAFTASPDDAARRVVRIVVVQRRQRRLGNLNRLLGALAERYGVVSSDGKILLHDANFSSRRLDVVVADFQFLSTAEQVTLVSHADVLFGVHGTALQWMFLMKPGSVLVEVQYPSLGCVHGSVLDQTSSPHTRLFCEFGKTSVASMVTHVAYMTGETFGDGMKVRFNVILRRSTFLALLETSLCALRFGTHASSARCQRYYPAS